MLKELQDQSSPRDTPEEVEKVRKIFEAAADFYQVPFEEFLKSRTFVLSKQRQIALYLAATHTRCTLTTIGEICGGRGESLVSQSVHTIKDLLKKGDGRTARHIRYIEEMLGK